MIQGVVIVEGAVVTEVYMADDRDELCIIDMDVLAIGMCPVCNEGLSFGICPTCEINFNALEDGCDIANRLLVDKVQESLAEAADEQFVEDSKQTSFC